MPRIYTSQSDPIDFCAEHFPDQDFAFDLYGNLGDGPDGRGNCFSWDDDHPAYEPEHYFCEVCGRPLDHDQGDY